MRNRLLILAIAALCVASPALAQFLPTVEPFSVAGPPPPPNFSGATASIGGSLLIAGGCVTGTATVQGATTTMVAIAAPQTYPGVGVSWFANVTSANTVTVYVCGLVAVTPASTIYSVRVIQ